MSALDAVGSAASGLLGGGSGSSDVTPGTVSAWALTFFDDFGTDLRDLQLSVGSSSYDGSVTATLPDGLEGGSYEVVVEGLTDEDYARIQLGPTRKLAAKLYLWWQDSVGGVLGDLANFSGLAGPLLAGPAQPPQSALVAVLRVDRISRRVGERRYDTVLTLRERVLARLAEARVEGRCYDRGLVGAVQAVADAAHVTITGHQLDQIQPGQDQPNFGNTMPGTALEALRANGQLIAQVRDGLKLYGSKPVLVRDGELHLGKWTVPALNTRTVDETGGLLSVERGDNVDRDAAAGEAPSGAPASRGAVTVVAAGRPDIKPGDLIQVQLPPQDFPHTAPASLGAALLTALTGAVTGSFTDEPTGPPARCLVRTVNHRLSRRGGFATRITAVVLAAESDDGWDPPATEPAAPAVSQRSRGAVPADPAHAAASAIGGMVRDANRLERNRIGQVRSHPASTQSGRTPPRHTSTIWYSDVAADGLPALAQRIQISDSRHGEAREVPYLTPFAWGPYGLALPRYPGTRVLLATAEGNPADLVDIGAIWPRDGGPPARAGDYWLVLPIGVQQAEDIGEGDGVVDNGNATHDLIDGDGTRLIETKRFIVRVNDQPTVSSSRPEPGNNAPAGSVVIENISQGNTARIVLKEDGSITITGTSITFDTGGQGDITLKANNVKVSVTGTMDVS